MATYSFSTTVGFAGNSDNITTLSTNISNALATFAGISTVGDSITVTFSGPLDDADASTLQGLITALDVPSTLGNNVLSFQVNVNQAISSQTTVVIFQFPGSNIINNITNIQLIGQVSAGTYSVTLYDVTNIDTIATATFSNTTASLIDLGAISNIPYSPAVWEIQCNVSIPASTVVLSSLAIYYS